MTAEHAHDNGRAHDDEHPRVHDHEHDHAHVDDHDHGLLGRIKHALVPHSHDSHESIDDALESSRHGVRAVKIGLVGLGATAIIQLVIAVISGSVALLADTVHNASDALTAIPLWIAFVVGRRLPSRRYTYGFGRLEDLAGLFIVAMIALSAFIAGYQSIKRLIRPADIDQLGWVMAAGVIGFIGNELVAQYRIRVGRRIGSAALVADGVHARTDGFTSLAVVAGVIGVWFGFPLADPIVGILISLAIVAMLIGTGREVLRRLLDGVDPSLVARAEASIEEQPGIDRVQAVRVRWLGHRLVVEADVHPDPAVALADFEQLRERTERSLAGRLPVAVLRLMPARVGADVKPEDDWDRLPG